MESFSFFFPLLFFFLVLFVDILNFKLFHVLYFQYLYWLIWLIFLFAFSRNYICTVCLFGQPACTNLTTLKDIMHYILSRPIPDVRMCKHDSSVFTDQVSYSLNVTFRVWFFVNLPCSLAVTFFTQILHLSLIRCAGSISHQHPARDSCTLDPLCPQKAPNSALLLNVTITEGRVSTSDLFAPCHASKSWNAAQGRTTPHPMRTRRLLRQRIPFL